MWSLQGIPAPVAFEYDYQSYSYLQSPPFWKINGIRYTAVVAHNETGIRLTMTEKKIDSREAFTTSLSWLRKQLKSRIYKRWSSYQCSIKRTTIPFYKRTACLSCSLATDSLSSKIGSSSNSSNSSSSSSSKDRGFLHSNLFVWLPPICPPLG